MAVIITDMKMPSTCSNCEFGKRWDNASTFCERHPSEPPVSDLYLKRPNHCPLKKAQEIVQCKDCYKQKICYPGKDELQPEFYCADGAKKDELHEKLDCREDCCGNCVHSIKTDMEGWVVCQIFDCSKTDDMVCNQYEWNLK